MKKVYIDLAITIVCILLILKFTLPFLILVGILALIWFFVLSENNKAEIKNKIADFYKK